MVSRSIGFNAIVGCLLAFAAEYAAASSVPVGQVEKRSAEDIIAARVRPDDLSELSYSEDSPFGVCHLGAPARYMNNLGVSWCRIGVPEFEIKEAERWAEKEDEAIPFSDEAKEILKDGGEILGLINFKGNAEKWANSDDESYLPVVRTCTYKMVRTHRTRVDVWEVMNEPDLFVKALSPRQVAAITNTAVTAAREADPDCTILSPCPTSIAYMEKLLQMGVGDMVDGFAVHIYAQGVSFSKQMELWKEMFAEYGYGDKPIWMTETGWRSDVEHGLEAEELRQQWYENLEAQARYVVTSHVRLRAASYQKLMWYAYTDVRDVHAAENWGLLWKSKRAGWPRKAKWTLDAGDWAVKPGGLAYHAMVEQLQGKEMKRELSAGIDTHMFEFSGPGGEVVVAWSDTRMVYPIPVRGKALQVTDLYGKQHTFEAQNGTVNLELTGAPVYIKGASVDKLEPHRCLVKWPEDLILEAGQTEAVQATLQNESGEPFAGRLVFTGSPGISVMPGSADVSLKTDGEKEIDVSVRVAPGLPRGRFALRCILHRGDRLPPAVIEHSVKVTN